MRDLLRRIVQHIVALSGFGSVVAGGLAPAGTAVADTLAVTPRSEPPQPLVFERPNYNELQRFAGHSSHASHASHASHSSHYSGSGGGYAIPDYSAAPVPAVEPPAPALPKPSAALKGTPYDQYLKQKDLMVLRVQAKLHDAGYYAGIIDGKMGPATTDALQRYQEVKGLPATGRMDDQTLAALGINY